MGIRTGNTVALIPVFKAKENPLILICHSSSLALGYEVSSTSSARTAQSQHHMPPPSARFMHAFVLFL